MELVNILAGLLVGMLVGATGVGGGSLMAPILILMVGVPPTTAVGTDLWFAAITKSVGGAVHQHSGQPDWRVVRLLAMGSLPAAMITVFALAYFGQSQIKDGVILKALGGILLLTAVAMLARRQIHARAKRLEKATANRFRTWQPPLTVLTGAVLGVLVALTSVGAGALCATALTLLYPLRMKAARLVGTDIIHAVPLTLVAGLGHFWIGNVDFGLLGSLLLGSIPGIIVGSLAASRLPDRYVRYALAATLTAVSLKLIL